MIYLKKDLANQEIPIRLFNGSNVPQLSKTVSDVVIKLRKAGEADLSTRTTISGEWNELSNGLYILTLLAGDVDTEGLFIWEAEPVVANAFLPFAGIGMVLPIVLTDVATATALTTAKTEIIAEVDANEVKLDGLQLSADAIYDDMATETTVTGGFSLVGSLVGINSPIVTINDRLDTIESLVQLDLLASTNLPQHSDVIVGELTKTHTYERNFSALLNGVPVTGILYPNISIEFTTEDGVGSIVATGVGADPETTAGVDAGYWREVDAVNRPGLYRLTFIVPDVEGDFEIKVFNSEIEGGLAFDPIIRHYEVKAAQPEDNATYLNLLGDAVGINSPESGMLQTLSEAQTKLVSIEDKVDDLPTTVWAYDLNGWEGMGDTLAGYKVYTGATLIGNMIGFNSPSQTLHESISMIPTDVWSHTTIYPGAISAIIENTENQLSTVHGKVDTLPADTATATWETDVSIYATSEDPLAGYYQFKAAQEATLVDSFTLFNSKFGSWLGGSGDDLRSYINDIQSKVEAANSALGTVDEKLDALKDNVDGLDLELDGVALQETLTAYQEANAEVLTSIGTDMAKETTLTAGFTSLGTLIAGVAKQVWDYTFGSPAADSAMEWVMTKLDVAVSMILGTAGATRITWVMTDLTSTDPIQPYLIVTDGDGHVAGATRAKMNGSATLYLDPASYLVSYYLTGYTQVVDEVLTVTSNAATIEKSLTALPPAATPAVPATGFCRVTGEVAVPVYPGATTVTASLNYPIRIGETIYETYFEFQGTIDTETGLYYIDVPIFATAVPIDAAISYRKLRATFYFPGRTEAVRFIPAFDTYAFSALPLSHTP